VRSFGTVFPQYLRDNLLASQRCFEAAVRDGVRVVFCVVIFFLCTARLSVTRHLRTHRRGRSRPYGITKLSCEHLASAYRSQFELDCVVLRYFSTRSGRASAPTWLSRESQVRLPTISVHALRRR